MLKAQQKRAFLIFFLTFSRIHFMVPEPTAGTYHSARRHAAAGRQFSLFVSERKLLLALFDLLLLNCAFGISLQLRAVNDSLFRLAPTPATGKFFWFALLSLLYVTCALIIGAYDLVRAASIRRSIGHAAVALFLAWTAFLFIPFLTPTLPPSRLHVVLFPILGVLGLSLWRLVYALVFAHPNFQQRALVIGAGGAGKTLVAAIREASRGQNPDGTPRGKSGLGYSVLGFVDDAVAPGTSVEGVSVAGNRGDLERLVGEMNINEIVVAITHLETLDPELLESIQRCREWGVSVTTMADLYERISGRVPIEHAGSTLAVAMPIVQKPTHRFYLVVQRAIDILGALVGCVLLGVFIPGVWLANRLGSPGPLFYCQERVGRGGYTFQIMKFRSMRVDAEKFGAVWAQENDPRITPIGKFLRGTRLDEFPQFVNILKGDMSLIGPRPERPQFVSQLTREIPFYRVRHAVKPGLTGWAQVKYRYGASVEDSLIKLQYDLFYIKRQSLLLDLEIMFKTIPIITGFKGR